MNLEKNLEKSIDLYLNNWGFILRSTLMAVILSLVSLGILTGPLFGGLLLLNLKILRNKPAAFNEIFGHFDKFLPTLVLCLASGICSFIAGKIPVIGPFINILLSPFLLIVTSFAIIKVIETEEPPITAAKEVIRFLETDPLIIWIYCLIALILSAIGLIIFGIGILLTIPFATVCMSVAYQEYSDKLYFKVSGFDPQRPPV